MDSKITYPFCYHSQNNHGTNKVHHKSNLDLAFQDNYIYPLRILNDATLNDSTAYIQGWLKKLRNDKKFDVEASAKAQKVVDYILNIGS